MRRGSDASHENALTGRCIRHAALQADCETPDRQHKHGKADIDVQIGAEQVTGSRLATAIERSIGGFDVLPKTSWKTIKAAIAQCRTICVAVKPSGLLSAFIDAFTRSRREP